MLTLYQFEAAAPMSHSSIYDDAAHYDLVAKYTAPADVPFYLRHLSAQPGEILELGCGTGRITTKLANAGLSVTAVDCAPALLNAARQRDSRPRWVQADFRELELDTSFDWVLLPYNAWNHLYTTDDVITLLETARRHLRTDGTLIVDTFHPNPRALSLAAEPPHPIVQLTTPDGVSIVMNESNHYDPTSQINTITWTYTGGGLNQRVDVLSMRIFFPRELRVLFRLANWNIDTVYGDYDSSRFGPHSPKQLVFARPG